ncbi:MAG: YbgC/FadM family acyl-CoA thioesterase [Pseudomonadota bacterium]
MMRFDIRVYFEDTDFTGRVYHGAFVRFLERGRTEALRAARLDHQMLASAQPPLYFTIRKLALSFHGPALIDDVLTVVSTPSEGRATILFQQEILKGDDTLVKADVELCLIDGRGRPQRPPASIREALRPG